MKKKALVVGKKDNFIILDVERTGSCGDKCATCKSKCDSKFMRIELETDGQYEKGQLIDLEMSENTLVKSSFILYTVPLLFFVIGILSGYYTAGSFGFSRDIFGIIVGFVFLGISLLLVRWISERHTKNLVKIK